MKARIAWAAVCAILCSLLVPNATLTGRGWIDDYSVFAYIGWLMQRGYVPYRDVWDHKGPLLYYINSLGWRITPQSTVGIGVLQLAVIAACFFVVFWVLTPVARTSVLLITALLSVTFAAVTVRGGDMSESWAVGATALVISTLVHAANRIPRWWHAILIGTAGAAAFWLRPNLCTPAIVAGVILLFLAQKRRGNVHACSLLGMGIAAAAIETTALLYPIWRDGALQDLWKAYFVYNSNYTRLITTSARLQGTAGLLLVLGGLALPIAGIAGWEALRRNLLNRSPHPLMFPLAFTLFLLICLPLETVACLASGRPYLHYWLPLWPALTIVGGVGVEWLFEKYQGWSSTARVFAAVVFCLVMVQQIWKIVDKEREAFTAPTEELAVATYIDRITTSEDRILPIGDVKAVLIALRAHRLPASPSIYQFPIIHRANPDARAQRTAFLQQLRDNPPAVIFSMPGVVGSLCRAAQLDAAYINAAKEEGYEHGLIPAALEPELAASYRLVADQAFSHACVYVRR